MAGPGEEKCATVAHFRGTAAAEVAIPCLEAGLEIRSLIKTKVPKIEYHRYVPRTSAHFRRFFQLVREYLDDLDRGSFVYRPGFGCTMCDFRDGPCGEALGWP